MFEGLFGRFETLGQGTSRIHFAINPLLAYVALPAALLGSVTVATAVSCRQISAATLSTLTTEQGAVMTTATILDAQALTKAFNGHTVLHAVDLQVRDGEFVSVMGLSGSGKSTLLYDISGMDAMTSGSVVFAGQDLAALSQKQLARLRLTTMGVHLPTRLLAEKSVPARQRGAAGLPGRVGPARGTQRAGDGADGTHRNSRTGESGRL